MNHAIEHAVMCVCAHRCMCMYVHVCRGQGQLWVLFRHHHLNFETVSHLPDTRQLMILARLTGHQTPLNLPSLIPTPIPSHRDSKLRLDFFHRSRGLNSGPHACKASTLLTEPSPPATGLYVQSFLYMCLPRAARCGLLWTEVVCAVLGLDFETGSHCLDPVSLEFALLKLVAILLLLPPQRWDSRYASSCLATQ